MSTQSVVEMQKIINETPFDTLWVFWESDVELVENSSTFTDTFSETFYYPKNSSDKIVVRTHNQLLSGYTASLIVGSIGSPIPIGTYSVGSYSLVIKETGVVAEVQLEDVLITKGDEWSVPRETTTTFEWVCDTSDLVPYYSEQTDKYVSGCPYVNLRLRT